jgi:hypothetical protein
MTCATHPVRTAPGSWSRAVSTTDRRVALASPPPDEIEEIVVRGRKPEPLPEQRLIPQGLIGAVAYGFANPLQAWRILVPDPNVQIPDRSEDDVRDPPGAHRARILEPGRIYD